MKVSLSELVLIYACIGESSSENLSTSCPSDWTQDPDDSTKCLPDATSSDFSVTCGASSMLLTFNYNHLYENIESFLDGNSLEDTGTTVIGQYTDGKAACNIIRAGNYTDGKFTLSIDYTSSCATLLHANDEISISTLVQGHSNLATVTDYDNGVEVHVGQVLSFNAVCKWSDTESVEIGALSVTTEDFSSNAGTANEGDGGYTSFEPSFSMAAYSDSTRKVQMDLNSDSAEIGESVHLTIVSDQTIESGGAFEWYVTDCTVYAEENSGGSSYPIIKDDSQCGSSFLHVSTATGEWVADSASSLVSFQLIAFQFAQAASDSIYLQCNIKMCLSTESCQPSCSSCPTGYQCMTTAPTEPPPSTTSWTYTAGTSCDSSSTILTLKSLKEGESFDDCKLACHASTGCTAIRIKKSDPTKCMFYSYCQTTADVDYDHYLSPSTSVITWQEGIFERCSDSDETLHPKSVKSETECKLACINDQGCTRMTLDKDSGECGIYASCTPTGSAKKAHTLYTPTSRAPVTWTTVGRTWCDESKKDTTMIRPQLDLNWNECKLACENNPVCTAIYVSNANGLCALFTKCSPSTSSDKRDVTASVAPYSSCVKWNSSAIRCNGMATCSNAMWQMNCSKRVGLDGDDCEVAYEACQDN